MKATVLDLRKRMKDILDSLRRNEPVDLFRRGRKIGTLYPPETGPRPAPGLSASDHKAFGLWKDRPDLDNMEAVIEKLRGGRFDAL